MDILTVEDEEEEEATKLYGGNDVWLYGLTSAMAEVNGQLHNPAALPPKEEHPVPILCFCFSSS
jgi:hypothetical protein